MAMAVGKVPTSDPDMHKELRILSKAKEAI